MARMVVPLATLIPIMEQFDVHEVYNMSERMELRTVSATGMPVYLGMEENGVDGVDGLSGVRVVTVSPDGLHIYAAGYWDEAVVAFGRHYSQVYLPLVLSDY